jgi:hypothetical protein
MDLLLTAFFEGFAAGFFPVFFRGAGFLTLALAFLALAGLRVSSSVLQAHLAS